MEGGTYVQFFSKRLMNACQCFIFFSKCKYIFYITIVSIFHIIVHKTK